MNIFWDSEFPKLWLLDVFFANLLFHRPFFGSYHLVFAYVAGGFTPLRVAAVVGL